MGDLKWQTEYNGRLPRFYKQPAASYDYSLSEARQLSTKKEEHLSLIHLPMPERR